MFISFLRTSVAAAKKKVKVTGAKIRLKIPIAAM